MMYKKFTTTMMGLTLMMTMLILAGCSGDLSGPLGPQSRNPAVFVPFSLGEVDDTGTLTKPVTVTQQVDETGGTVVLAGTVEARARVYKSKEERRSSTQKENNQKVTVDYEYKLTFPPGALSGPTGISIILANPRRAMFWLEPNIEHFNAPVNLSVTVRSDQVEPHNLQKVLDIYWHDDVNDEWVRLFADIVWEGENVHATVDLHHFSKYALGGY